MFSSFLARKQASKSEVCYDFYDQKVVHLTFVYAGNRFLLGRYYLSARLHLSYGFVSALLNEAKHLWCHG